MAKAYGKNIEKLITRAFDDLVSGTERSKHMGRIARRPNGTQEKTIRDIFSNYLKTLS